MVIQDYTKSAKNLEKKQPEDLKNALREQVALFMESQKNNVADDTRTTRIPNVTTIQSLDTAMQLGIGRDLAEFSSDVRLTCL